MNHDIAYYCEFLTYHPIEGCDNTPEKLRRTVLSVGLQSSIEDDDDAFVTFCNAVADDEIILQHAITTAEATQRATLSGLDDDLIASHELYNLLHGMVSNLCRRVGRVSVNSYYETLQPVSNACDMGGQRLPDDLCIDEGIGVDCKELIDAAILICAKVNFSDTGFNVAEFCDTIYDQMRVWYYS